MKIVRISDFVLDKFCCFFEKNSVYFFWSFFSFSSENLTNFANVLNFFAKFSISYHGRRKRKETLVRMLRCRNQKQFACKC
jgi:hypothetical protein